MFQACLCGQKGLWGSEQASSFDQTEGGGRQWFHGEFSSLFFLLLWMTPGNLDELIIMQAFLVCLLITSSITFRKWLSCHLGVSLGGRVHELSSLWYTTKMYFVGTMPVWMHGFAKYVQCIHYIVSTTKMYIFCTRHVWMHGCAKYVQCIHYAFIHWAVSIVHRPQIIVMH